MYWNGEKLWILARVFYLFSSVFVSVILFIDVVDVGAAWFVKIFIENSIELLGCNVTNSNTKQ